MNAMPLLPAQTLTGVNQFGNTPDTESALCSA